MTGCPLFQYSQKLSVNQCKSYWPVDNFWIRSYWIPIISHISNTLDSNESLYTVYFKIGIPSEPPLCFMGKQTWPPNFHHVLLWRRDDGDHLASKKPNILFALDTKPSDFHPILLDFELESLGNSGQTCCFSPQILPFSNGTPSCPTRRSLWDRHVLKVWPTMWDPSLFCSFSGQLITYFQIYCLLGTLTLPIQPHTAFRAPGISFTHSVASAVRYKSTCSTAPVKTFSASRCLKVTHVTSTCQDLTQKTLKKCVSLKCSQYQRGCRTKVGGMVAEQCKWDVHLRNCAGVCETDTYCQTGPIQHVTSYTKWLGNVEYHRISRCIAVHNIVIYDSCTLTSIWTGGNVVDQRMSTYHGF